MPLTRIKSLGITDGTIVNADINASAAIAGTKLGAGTVLQVVSTAKTDIFSTSSTSFTDVTGLSVSITPSSASNKILIYMDVKLGSSTNVSNFVRLMRSATPIYIGDSSGSRTQGTYGNSDDPSNQIVFQGVGIFLDSPNTTSATTYKVQMLSEPSGNTGTVFLNKSGEDADSDQNGRFASSITVMEIAV
jgi:hypothetical protein